jgi:hypothetical protein
MGDIFLLSLCFVSWSRFFPSVNYSQWPKLHAKYYGLVRSNVSCTEVLLQNPFLCTICTLAFRSRPLHSVFFFSSMQLCSMSSWSTSVYLYS